MTKQAIIRLRAHELLIKFRILNTKEICRALNGFEIKGECRKSDYKTFKTGNMWLSACKLCELSYGEIYTGLKTLQRRKKVYRHKMIFYDDHPQARKTTDLFTFWFVDPDEFKRKILSQTLDVFLQP